MIPAPAEYKLHCAECGSINEGDAERWRAYLDDEDHVAVFCPECASREFDHN